jgi:hypothetical protein
MRQGGGGDIRAAVLVGQVHAQLDGEKSFAGNHDSLLLSSILSE